MPGPYIYPQVTFDTSTLVIPSSTVTQAASNGTGTCVTDVVAGTKGAWSQVWAASAFATKALAFCMLRSSGSNETYQFDIGTGGAGAEVVKVPDIAYFYSAGGVLSGPASFSLFVIPVGTRIAVRAANMTGAVARTLTFNFIIYG